MPAAPAPYIPTFPGLATPAAAVEYAAAAEAYGAVYGAAAEYGVVNGVVYGAVPAIGVVKLLL
jgi:hypothetical protein